MSLGFIFAISIDKYEKKGIKFPDSSVLSFILFFKKSEISQFLDKLSLRRRHAKPSVYTIGLDGDR